MQGEGPTYEQRHRSGVQGSHLWRCRILLERLGPMQGEGPTYEQRHRSGVQGSYRVLGSCGEVLVPPSGNAKGVINVSSVLEETPEACKDPT
jgi:hypothetical protein